MEGQRVIDLVAFAAPAGLEDATRWAFGSEAEPEVLTVELEAPAGGATPAADVVAELRESITGVFPFGEILDEGQTMLDGRRAWFLAYAVGPDYDPAVGMAVVANLPGGDFVKLHLRVSDRAELGPRFGPTLGSVSLHGGPAPVPAGPGYRREQAGPIALDVPQELVAPRSHVFADAEDRLRLRVTVRPVGIPPFDLAAAVARDAATAELLEREEQAWSWGRWARYRRRSVDPPHREQAVARASLTVTVSPGGPEGSPAVVRELEIQGIAVPKRAAALFAAFDALLASVRPHPGPARGEGAAR